MRELLEENPGRLICLLFPSSQQGDRLPGRRGGERGKHRKEGGVESAVKPRGPTQGREARLSRPNSLLSLRNAASRIKDSSSPRGLRTVSLHPARCCYPRPPGSGALGPAAYGQRGCWPIWRTLGASGGSPWGCQCVLGSLNHPHKPGLGKMRQARSGWCPSYANTHQSTAHPRGGDGDPAGPAAVSRGGRAEEARGEEKDVHTKQPDRLTDEGAGTGCRVGVGGGPGLQKHVLPLSKQTFLPRGPVLPRSPGAPAVPPLPWSRRRGERQ